MASLTHLNAFGRSVLAFHYAAHYIAAYYALPLAAAEGFVRINPRSPIVTRARLLARKTQAAWVRDAEHRAIEYIDAN